MFTLSVWPGNVARQLIVSSNYINFLKFKGETSGVLFLL